MKAKLIRVDQQDLRILNFLRKNARQTLTNMSRETGVPISTVFDKLKKLENLGIVKRHTSLFDMEKIGYSTHAFVFLKCDDKQNEHLEKCLTENPNINNIARVNGQWDLLFEGFYRDIRDLEVFIEALINDFKGVELSIHHALKDIKREGFLIGDKRLKTD